MPSQGERHLGAVPDQPAPNVYGHIEFFDGVNAHRLTVGGYYGGPMAEYTEDVLIARDGWVVRHPYGSGRESTEDERAAVGWTW